MSRLRSLPSRIRTVEYRRGRDSLPYPLTSAFPPPLPLPSLPPRRHLRFDSETQTRDFYGIEIDLAERKAEKEKWRGILAERAERRALAASGQPLPEEPIDGDDAPVADSSSALSPRASSLPTAASGASVPSQISPPAVPAPASSMTLGDFHLEPRRARLARKNVALNRPFFADATTLLPSGITVRFDEQNLPLTAYPDEPLQRPPRVTSLIQALTPLASVKRVVDGLENVRPKEVDVGRPKDEDGRRKELEDGRRKGMENGRQKELEDGRRKELEDGRQRVLSESEDRVSFVGAVNEREVVPRRMGVGSEKAATARVAKIPRNESPVHRRNTTNDVKDVRRRSSLKPTTMAAETTSPLSDDDPRAAESSSDMNYFDEQLMLAQFDLGPLAAPSNRLDVGASLDVDRHRFAVEDSTARSIDDFHRDLERMGRGREAEGPRDDLVKESLAHDMNYFDSLYVENSDWGGMALNGATSASTGVAAAAAEEESPAPAVDSDLNFFDEQIFDESTLAAAFRAESTKSAAPDSEMSKAAAFVDAMESASLQSRRKLATPSHATPDPTPQSSSKSSSLTTSSPLSFTPKFQYDPGASPSHTKGVLATFRGVAAVEADAYLKPPSGTATTTSKASASSAGKAGARKEVGAVASARGSSLDGESVSEKRKNDPLAPPALKGDKRVDARGFRKYSDLVTDFTWASAAQLTEVLHRRVIYDKDGIVAIDKPFGLACQQGAGLRNAIDDILPSLADATGHKKLTPVHRLDQSTSGVLIFAANDLVKAKLKTLFAEQRILKVYYALVKGKPQFNHGSIKIPLMDFKLTSGYRTMVAPDRHEVEEDTMVQGLLKDLIDKAELRKMAGKPKESFPAVTNYEVLGENYGISLLEVQPETGFKHQIRAHLAYGLNTPILGDHKYSYKDAHKPQKLNGAALQALHIRQPLARHIPLQLHAKTVVLPEFNAGRNVFLSANLPFHFKEMLRKLKINIPNIKGGTEI